MAWVLVTLPLTIISPCSAGGLLGVAWNAALTVATLASYYVEADYDGVGGVGRR